VRTLLEQQYAALAAWLEEVPASGHLGEPVGLGDWTVRELVAHLGLGIGLSRFVSAAPNGSEPLTFGQYVGHYPPNADQIDRQTHDLTERLGDDVVAGFRRLASEAFAALDATPGAVLQARRGPIARSDYLTTRLLELVVHADDLQRALDRSDAPLVPAAVDAVADALAAAYRERTGRAPDHGAGMGWIRRAAGRLATDDPDLPLL
jgi:uncharacterized protein (TIGR03083 family)